MLHTLTRREYHWPSISIVWSTRLDFGCLDHWCYFSSSIIFIIFNNIHWSIKPYRDTIHHVKLYRINHVQHQINNTAYKISFKDNPSSKIQKKILQSASYRRTILRRQSHTIHHPTREEKLHLGTIYGNGRGRCHDRVLLDHRLWQEWKDRALDTRGCPSRYGFKVKCWASRQNHQRDCTVLVMFESCTYLLASFIQSSCMNKLLYNQSHDMILCATITLDLLRFGEA